jgi:GNAT superfamily N-acetyltransferase
MSGFNIRGVAPTDVPALASMSDALGRFHDETTKADPVALHRDLFAAPPWVWGLIAEAGAQPIGYALMLPTAQVQHARRGIDLHHLYVAPYWRGKGVGRALMTNVETHARTLHCSYVTIGTDPQNISAQVAYESLGYIRRAPGPRFSKQL